MTTSSTRLTMILWGDAFPDEALWVLKSMSQVQVVAVLSDSAAAMKMANFYDIPLRPTSALAEFSAAVTDEPLMCWLSASSLSEPILVAELMDQGIAVLTDLPRPTAQLAQWVRHTRQSKGQLDFCMPLLDVPEVRSFISMASLLNDRAEQMRLSVRCSEAKLWSVVTMLNDMLSGIRRWQVSETLSLRYNEKQVSLDLVGVSVVLELISAEENGPELPSNVTVATELGVLTLTEAGSVTWQASGALTSQRLLEGESQQAGLKPSYCYAWQQVITRWCTACRGQERSLAEMQRYLTLSRLVDGVDDALATIEQAEQAEPLQLSDTQALVAQWMQAIADVPRSDATNILRLDWEKAAQAGLQRIGQGDGHAFIAKSALALRQLEQFSLHKMKRLLEASFEGLPVDGMTHQFIHSQVKPAAEHAWLLDRWLVALEKHGWLEQRQDLWYWTAQSEYQPEAELTQIYQRLGFPQAMSDLHQAILQQLPALITGQITIQEIIFAMAQPMEALSAYQRNDVTACINTVSTQLLEQWLAVQGKPELSVVEVGAGAGYFTQQHLPVLHKYLASYRFTDVSSLFTDRAEAVFAEEPALQASVLDINQDFAQQGILPESTDILLAGNVLHNAQDMCVTLHSMRRVLRRGGILLLTDSTEDHCAMLTSMQFLLSPSQTDTARSPGGDGYRQQGEVFLSLAGWQAVLPDAGFRLLGYFPEQDHALSASGQRVMLAVAA